LLKFKSYMKEINEGIKISDNSIVFSDDGQKTSFGKNKKLAPYVMKVNDIDENEYDIFSVYKRNLGSKDFAEIVSAIKKKSDVNIDKETYEFFIKRTAIYLTSNISDIMKNVDVILMPPTSSFILDDIVKFISERKPNIKIIKDSFVKNSPNEIKIDYDHQKMTDSIKKELEDIISRATKSGVFQVKKVRKQNRKFLYNTMIMNNSKIKESYIYDKNVLILDDLLTSGFTIKQMMSAISLFNPKHISGSTIFKM